MTTTVSQEAVEVTHADREAAWRHRPSCYKEHDHTDWLAGKYDSAAKVIQAFARHRIQALSKAGEPVGYIIAEMLNRRREYEGNGIVMTATPQGMSTLPLYTAPSSQRALVEALEAVKRSLEDAVCCDETMSHDEAYSEILYFGGTALASAYDKVCAALSLTKAQESGV